MHKLHCGTVFCGDWRFRVFNLCSVSIWLVFSDEREQLLKLCRWHNSNRRRLVRLLSMRGVFIFRARCQRLHELRRWVCSVLFWWILLPPLCYGDLLRGRRKFVHKLCGWKLPSGGWFFELCIVLGRSLLEYCRDRFFEQLLFLRYRGLLCSGFEFV